MFCRHGRFEDRCAICRGEKAAAAPKAHIPTKKGTEARRATSTPRAAAPASSARRGSRTVVTGKLSRNADDGYRSDLLPGVRSSADVQALATELTVAEARLSALGSPDSGPWSAVSAAAEEPARAFIYALVIAVASPDAAAGSAATAQAAIDALSSDELAVPSAAAGSGPVAAILDAGPRGPRGADAAGIALAAPAQLAQRSGSLAAAITGDASWSPERRFARVFDRLALKGLPRAVRYDVLVALGRSGVLSLRAGALHLGDDQVTAAAKRIFAVGDVSLLEKRAATLVEVTGVAWDALELALWNLSGADATGSGAASRWSTAKPATDLGLPGEPDAELAETIAAVLA